MNRIQSSLKFSLVAFAIISVIFLAVISPLKGLGVVTWPLLLLGIGCWLYSLLMFAIALIKIKEEKIKMPTLIITFLILIAFIPLGYTLMSISGDLRTRITIEVINQSDTDLHHVSIYGVGDLFSGTDTLKLDNLINDQQIKYMIRPSTEPQKGGGKKGYVQMEFDVDGKRIIKNIAGEFSVYPLNIKQNWVVIIDKKFLNN